MQKRREHHQIVVACLQPADSMKKVHIKGTWRNMEEYVMAECMSEKSEKSSILFYPAAFTQFSRYLFEFRLNFVLKFSENKF
jgi:hypothetical protein